MLLHNYCRIRPRETSRVEIVLVWEYRTRHGSHQENIFLLFVKKKTEKKRNASKKSVCMLVCVFMCICVYVRFIYGCKYEGIKNRRKYFSCKKKEMSCWCLVISQNVAWSLKLRTKKLQITHHKSCGELLLHCNTIEKSEISFVIM